MSVISREVVGNNAKGRILKRVLLENKACQIFRKTSISYPLIRTRALFSSNTRFEIRSFAFLPTL